MQRHRRSMMSTRRMPLCFEWEMRRAGQTIPETTGQELVTKDRGQTDASGRPMEKQI